jgi:nitrite reductase/ring-hydroxylating ferredoxin subunit
VSFERVARSEEVGGEHFFKAQAHGRTVLLARLSDGTVAAFGNICPHQGNPLDEGTLWDDEIDCPHHHYTYDPRTGRNRFPARVYPASRARTLRGIPVFDVREEDGWIFVGPVRAQPDGDDDGPA